MATRRAAVQCGYALSGSTRPSCTVARLGGNARQETGNYRASRYSALGYGRVTYQVVTYDRFGRTVVIAWAGRINLSCYQIQARQAIYKRHWDNGGLVGKACR